jgi:hypothetical protein
MRLLFTASVLCLLLSGGVASAQSASSAGAGASSSKPEGAAKAPGQAKPEAAKAPGQDLKTRTEAWFKDCKQGWDPGTHMTRKDYERTCLRMAQERVKFLREQEKTDRDRVKQK